MKTKALNMEELKGLRAKVAKSYETIAVERDKLREYFSDLEDITTAIDDATSSLEQAKTGLDEAIETLSQHL